MNRLQQWIYAIKVCRKYGIKWNPFRRLDNATFNCGMKGQNAKIHMSPFYENFIGVFLHEVGHILFWKKRGERFYWCLEVSGHETMYKQLNCRGRSYIGLLEEEALASRFSAKVLKSQENRNYLLKSFYTYTANFYECLGKFGYDGQDIAKTTDVVYSCIRRIEK